METTRVLIVTTTYLGFNGITSVIMNYYRNINREKVQFDFAIGLGIHDSVRDEINELGGKVYELPSRKKSTINYLMELKKLVVENKYRIVHAHGNSGTLYLDIHALKKAGVPIRISHSHNSTCSHKIIHKMLKKPLNNEITHAIACSKLAGDWLYNKSYTVINNGIDVDKFLYNEETRIKYRKELGLEGKLVLGHIGHFSYQKNHEYLLEVFREVYSKESKAVLMLIGDGKLRGDIEAKIKDLGIENNVLLLGNRKDAAQLLQSMDIFVFPSRFEGLPVVLVETQASGLKCIVSDKITKECQITGRVKYLSLKDDKKEWVEEILNSYFEYERDNVKEKVLESNFNIKNETEKLEMIYLTCK